MLENLLPSLCGLAAVALICATSLRAWSGWLDLRRLELGRHPGSGSETSDAGVRIEIAAVRERLRRLEEIASGVEY